MNEVTFSKDGQSLLSLDALILDYSLVELLQKRLAINEIRLDGADVSLDLPMLQASMGPGEPKVNSPTEPAEIPRLPIAIDLKSLVMSRGNLSLIISPDVSLGLQGLNLAVSASVAGDTAIVDGSMRVAQVTVESEGKHLSLPFDLDFNLMANLSTQALHLNVLTVASHPAFTMTVSGDVTNFLGDPSVDLLVRDAQVSLAELHYLVNDFVPTKFRDVEGRWHSCTRRRRERHADAIWFSRCDTGGSCTEKVGSGSSSV